MTALIHQDAEQKISAARTKLILDKPFLGALVLRLGLQNADPSWCATTGTDAKKFYYNTEYILSLSASELQFVLSHEALHCALSHFARRQHRIKHRWDLACDYAINPILVDEGFKPPPNAMVLDEYREMSAEEIYPLIKDNDHSETMDQHLYDKPDNPKEGGKDKQQDDLNQQKIKTDKDKKPDQDNNKPQDKPEPDKSEKTPPEQDGAEPGSKQGQAGDKPSQKNPEPNQAQQFPDAPLKNANPEQSGELKVPPPSLSHAEIEDLQEKWLQRLAGAAQQAKLSGKMSALLERFIEAEISPRIPWRQLLSSHLSATARDDYSYARPNARRGDPAIFPVLKSAQLSLVVALDVSGSISDEELNTCISEINAIKGQLRARVTIIAADDAISKDYPQVFEPWQPLALSGTIQGGGGTDFRPVFDWMQKQDVPADALVYFSDAQGVFPEHAPHYPVIWLIKGRGKVPWGSRVQLN